MRRFRAILVGAALAALINVWEPFSYYVAHSSWMRFGYISVAVMLPFVVLVFPVNMALRAVRRELAFEPWELIIIFAMGMVAAIFPTLGLLGFLLSYISSPFYFASPENFWAEWMSRTMPRWLAPSDTGLAVQWLFNGLPAGERIPWAAWVVPLFWWGLLVAAMFLCSFCTMVILRRQWVDNERLAFPLAELPLMLMAKPSGGSIAPPCVRQPLFWVGFGIPFFIISWNLIQYFHQTFPTIPIGQWNWISLGRNFPGILCKVNFFVMGFAFFTPLNILLSVWLFYFLSVVQAGVFTTIGLNIGKPDNWCTFNAAVGWQNYGSFLVLVLVGFWMARRHLVGALRQALGLRGGVDDRGEVIRYRTAVLGLLVGGLVVVGWYLRAGMSPWVAAVFVPAGYIVYVGVTRLVAQTGLVYLWSPITPQSATFHILGWDEMSSADRLMVGMGYCVNCNNERLIPYTAAHNVRMAAVEPRAHKGFLLMMALAAAVSVAVGVAYTLYLAYRNGANNFDSFEWSRGNHWIFGILSEKELHAKGTDWTRLLFLGVGAAIAGVLSVFQYRFPWWPIHPVGLALGGSEPASFVGFSCFLVWIIKGLVVKLGGAQAYRRFQYLFVGIMVGYIVGVGVSFGVDCIWFPGNGHRIHVW